MLHIRIYRRQWHRWILLAGGLLAVFACFWGAQDSVAGAGDEPVAVAMDFEWQICDSCLYTTRYLDVISLVITGTEEFDVSDIVSGLIHFDGRFPLYDAIADVVSLEDIEAGDCVYGEPQADGYQDLILEFAHDGTTNATVNQPDDDENIGTITGMTWKGSWIELPCCIPPADEGEWESPPRNVSRGQRVFADSNYAHPNPFNATTVISFTVLEGSFVQLFVYDLLGRKVATLAESFRAPGTHSVPWDATDDTERPLHSGPYLYRLVVGDQVLTGKLLLVK